MGPPHLKKKFWQLYAQQGKGLATRCKSMHFNMVVSQSFATRCKSLHIGTVVSHLKLTPVSHPQFKGTHYSLPSIEFTTFNIKYLSILCMSSFCSQNIWRIIDKVIRLQVFRIWSCNLNVSTETIMTKRCKNNGKSDSRGTTHPCLEISPSAIILHAHPLLCAMVQLPCI